MTNEELQVKLDKLEERLDAGIEAIKLKVEAKAESKLWVVVSASLAIGAVVGFLVGQLL